MSFVPPFHACPPPEHWHDVTWLSLQPCASEGHARDVDNMQAIEQTYNNKMRSIGDKWRDRLPLGCSSHMPPMQSDDNVSIEEGEQEGNEEDDYDSGEDVEEMETLPVVPAVNNNVTQDVPPVVVDLAPALNDLSDDDDEESEERRADR